MKIKICGLTRPEDVALACGLGADACGFILAPSPRRVDLATLQSLLPNLPTAVLSVAVMVDPSQEEVDQALTLVDRVQLHGKEAPEFCRRYGRKAWKAFRIRQPQDLDAVEAYRGSVGAYLLDSFMEGVAGGTGRAFPWQYLRDRDFALTTFLAGGLSSENVADAMQVACVHGLDVSSGIEAQPGHKDADKMKAFFSGARPTQR